MRRSIARAASPRSASGPATPSTAASARRRSAALGSSAGRVSSASVGDMAQITVWVRISACRASGVMDAKGSVSRIMALERTSRSRRTPPRAWASRIIMRTTASA